LVTSGNQSLALSRWGTQVTSQIPYQVGPLDSMA
jgi:hypothetical protein